MKKLKKSFTSRDELVDYIKLLCPHLKNDKNTGTIQGGVISFKERLDKINVEQYAKTRNYTDGSISMLSPFISRGYISEDDLINFVLKKNQNNFKKSERFIQQICWRIFWKKIINKNPNYLWQNVEQYKTGYSEKDYADKLPDDLLNANTNCECINQMITKLYKDGFLHNHLRLYLAAYTVHWRKVKWQVGAKWFLEHLIDFDLPSNNLSWQWVASTFSNKPYIFNLDNIRKFTTNFDTSSEHNKDIDKSYEDLYVELFPNQVRV